MTSTNHFRNRRITRAGAVAVRRPCDCPPPTTTPTVTPWVGTQTDLDFTDSIDSDTANFSADLLIQDDIQNWHVATTTNNNAWPALLSVIVNRLTPSFDITFAIDRGSGLETVGTATDPSYTGADFSMGQFLSYTPAGAWSFNSANSVFAQNGAG